MLKSKLQELLNRRRSVDVTQGSVIVSTADGKTAVSPSSHKRRVANGAPVASTRKASSQENSRANTAVEEHDRDGIEATATWPIPEGRSARRKRFRNELCDVAMTCQQFFFMK